MTEWSLSYPDWNSGPRTWSLHGPKGMLVSINMETGEHKFGEGYEPTEAAIVFWEAVGRTLMKCRNCDCAIKQAQAEVGKPHGGPLA